MILSNTEPAFTCSQLTAETREECVKSVFKVRSSHPEVFLEISQISQQNICASVSFLIKLQTSACNFIKKVTLAQVLSCEFYEVIDVVQLPLLLTLNRFKYFSGAAVVDFEQVYVGWVLLTGHILLIPSTLIFRLVEDWHIANDWYDRVHNTVFAAYVNNIDDVSRYFI